MASVHRVATIPQAPREFLLHGDGFVARGHRVEAPIQPRAKVLPMLPHIPRGSVAILVLTKALRRRHHALANVDGGIPGVAAGTLWGTQTWTQPVSCQFTSIMAR